MAETSWKKWLAVIVGAGVVVTWVADVTDAFDKLTNRSWVAFAQTLGPWLWYGLLFYCATALFVTFYKERQESKALRKQKRLKEIKRIKIEVESAGRELTQFFAEEIGQPHAAENAMRATSALIESLIESKSYEHSLELGRLVNRLRDHHWVPNSFDWEQTIRPGLKILEAWLSFAEQELQGPPSRTKDPFAKSIRDDGYVPPDPFGLYPPKK